MREIAGRVIVFFCTVCMLFSTAQDDNNTKLIDIKQRLLKPRSFSDDIKSEVDSNSILRLMIAGNLYQTEKHVNYCFDESTGKYNFREELKYIQPILGLGDLTIANLKTAFADDISNMFTSPDEFSLALKYSGINVLTHANAHTAQVDKATLKRTRDMLYDYEMLHTGAFTDGMQRNGNYPLIINKKGFRIALLNYTTLNSRPGISRDFIINEIDKTYIERDMRVARINKPDFIIVYFDWGTNNQDIPSSYQTDLAQYCFNLGANLVVGALPNTPLRLDYMTYSQYGQLKEGIVAYSLGNLIASNDEVRNRNGYVIDMELKKNNFTGETNVGDWGVIPVYTYYDTSSVKGKTRILSLPCSAVENGDILQKIPYIEKRRVINGAYEVRKLLGATADEIQYNLTELTANNVMETIDLTKSALNNRFNQKKASDIKPTAAPVLPVATVGSNNPPSLAQIFGEGKPVTETKPQALLVKNEPPKVSAVEAERNKAENLFIEAKGNSLPAATEQTKMEKKPIALKKDTSDASPNSTSSVSSNSTQSAPVLKEKVVTENTVAQTTTQKEANSDVTNKTITESKQSVKSSSELAIQKSSPASNEVSEQLAPNTTSENQANIKKANGTTVTTDDVAKSKQKAVALEDDIRKKKNIARQAEDDLRKIKTEVIVFEDDPKKQKAAAASYSEDKTIAGKQTAGAIENNQLPSLPINLERMEQKSVSITVDTFYRIQIYALQKFIPLDTNYYTHLKGYEVVEENGLFKYLLGKYRRKEDCEQFWKEQILPRYKTSFVVQYIDGKRKFE